MVNTRNSQCNGQPNNKNSHNNVNLEQLIATENQLMQAVLQTLNNMQPNQQAHQRPAGLLQPLKIPEWKWEEIRMDFIVGLPRTQAGYDSIWVIVDRLTKVDHFIPVKMTYSGAKLAELYMS
jgi:hypothetical protein